MTEHPDPLERRMLTQLGRQLDSGVRPFDPAVIASRAVADSRPSALRVTAVAATIALATMVAVAVIQEVRLADLPVGSPGGGEQAQPHSTGSPADDATRGPVPESAHRADGTIDLSQVPDFIPALDGDDAVGWIARDDAFPTEGSERPQQIAVYGDDLRTVVGHLVANVGFVAVGTDPALLSPGPQPTFWAEEP